VASTSHGRGFLQLGRGPTITRQVWVTNVEMAISVAKVAQGNFCSQEVIKVLRTPHHGKPQYQEQTQPCLPSPHATSQTRKTKIRARPGSSSCLDCLSRPPYHRIRPANQTNSPANHLVLYPMFIHPPRIPMSKGPRHIYPTATPSKTLRPYDKICVHLLCLHTRIKTP
jgi:hypothetical protein